MASSVEIFFSYSHKDETLREELEKRLSLLKWQELITGWHDRRIIAGQEWADEIDMHLNTAQIILLLVSPDFMASKYCYSKEMKRAMERHERGEARVIPVILRPVYWQGAPFGKLQGLPEDAKPITDPAWHDLDQALFNVAEGIRKVIVELTAKGKEQWLKEGKAHFNARRYKEALTACEEALRIDPNYVDAYLTKGNMFLNLKRNKEALDTYERVIQLDPGNWDGWHNKGRALRGLNRNEEAVSAVDQAYRIRPNKWDLYHKGEAFYNLQRYEEALDAYEKALQIDPNFTYARRGRGTVLRSLMRYEEALAEFEQAIHLDPDNATFYVHKGNILYDLERYTDALTASERATQLKPDYMWAWHNKGNVHERLAQQAHEKAKQLGYKK